MIMVIKADALQIDLQTYNFYGNQPYTEVYLRVDGHSVEWKEKTASVEILMYIMDNEGNIIKYDKFALSLVTQDSITDLLALERYHFEPGNYTIRIEGKDLFKDSNIIEMEQRLTVSLQIGSPVISDIIPLGEIRPDSTSTSLSKNGFYMEPLAYHYVDQSRSQINLYLECYQESVSETDLFLQYAIMEGDKLSTNNDMILTRFKKLQGLEVEPVVLSLPVKIVRSGNYYLYISIVDKQKNILASRSCDIVISNPSADIAYLENYNETPENAFVTNIKSEDIDYILKAHLPITDQNQISTLNELIKSNKIRSQRQFIFQLWKGRSPLNPEKAYKMYMEVASAVDKLFYSNVGYGFQTDRGYIFLKYGKPSNVLTIDDELDAPPYEIWYYNSLPSTSQTNVRFLFYNPSLAHKDFRLLHSTCIGERSNPTWEVELYKSVPMERQGNSTDATTVGPNWNRNARKYFNEF